MRRPLGRRRGKDFFYLNVFFSLLSLLCQIDFSHFIFCEKHVFSFHFNFGIYLEKHFVFSLLFLLWNLQVLSLNFWSAFLFLTWIFHDRGQEYLHSFKKTTRPWDHANYLGLNMLIFEGKQRMRKAHWKCVSLGVW